MDGSTAPTLTLSRPGEGNRPRAKRGACHRPSAAHAGGRGCCRPSIAVEIIDAAAKIDAFIPVLDEIMGCGLVTLEPVKVLRYGDGSPA
jgi:hypothetical protein